MPQSLTFIPGRSYVMRLATDADARIPVQVVSRTAKFVTIIDPRDGRQVKRRVRLLAGVEEIQPHGQYSMAPVLRADRVVA